MLKKICKNVAWLALPVALAMGCASNSNEPTTAQADYGPTPVLTPTSGEPEQRVYTTDPATVTASTSVDTPPAGASADNWNVAEAIRQKLTADPTLAPLGSSLITQVGNDGVVTLKGSVTTEKEKQRVADAISSVPGVKSVNDEMRVGAYHGGGTLDMSK